eukprot:1013694-Pelagomonas_calceolata.AAC.9
MLLRSFTSSTVGSLLQYSLRKYLTRVDKVVALATAVGSERMPDIPCTTRQYATADRRLKGSVAVTCADRVFIQGQCST